MYFSCTFPLIRCHRATIAVTVTDFSWEERCGTASPNLISSWGKTSSKQCLRCVRRQHVQTIFFFTSGEHSGQMFSLIWQLGDLYWIMNHIEYIIKCQPSVISPFFPLKSALVRPDKQILGNFSFFHGVVNSPPEWNFSNLIKMWRI